MTRVPCFFPFLEISDFAQLNEILHTKHLWYTVLFSLSTALIDQFCAAHPFSVLIWDSQMALQQNRAKRVERERRFFKHFGGKVEAVWELLSINAAVKMWVMFCCPAIHLRFTWCTPYAHAYSFTLWIMIFSAPVWSFYVGPHVYKCSECVHCRRKCSGTFFIVSPLKTA